MTDLSEIETDAVLSARATEISLSDKPIDDIYESGWIAARKYYRDLGTRLEAKAALEYLKYPEGITDELLKRARRGAQDEWARINDGNINTAFGRAGLCGEAALRAALFPGEDSK